MKSFPELLTEFRNSLGLRTDADLARHLGHSTAYISDIRHQGKASDELCLKIADTLDVEPAEVLIARNALKESGAVGDAWRKYATKVASVVLIVGIASTSVPTKAGEGEILPENQQLTKVKDYRKYRNRLKLQRLMELLAMIFPVIGPSRKIAQDAL